MCLIFIIIVIKYNKCLTYSTYYILVNHFSQFGKIDEIDLPYDKEKNERRPFCFISFQTEQAAQEVLRLQRHTIGDINVDVKRAKPKTLNNQQQQLEEQEEDLTNSKQSNT